MRKLLHVVYVLQDSRISRTDFQTNDGHALFRSSIFPFGHGDEPEENPVDGASIAASSAAVSWHRPIDETDPDASASEEGRIRWDGEHSECSEPSAGEPDEQQRQPAAEGERRHVDGTELVQQVVHMHDLREEPSAEGQVSDSHPDSHGRETVHM